MTKRHPTPRELRLEQQVQWLEEERDALRAELKDLRRRERDRHMPKFYGVTCARDCARKDEHERPGECSTEPFFVVRSDEERARRYKLWDAESKRQEEALGKLLGLPQVKRTGKGVN